MPWKEQEIAFGRRGVGCDGRWAFLKGVPPGGMPENIELLAKFQP